MEKTKPQMLIDRLEHALDAYSPLEEALKAYYHANGRFMEISEFPFELVEDSVSMPHNDLKYIAGSVHSNDLRLFGAERRISEREHFLPGYDIFLQKHARYLRTELHDHDYFEICYQYRGTCRQIFKTGSGDEELILNQGDFLMIPPGQRHIASALDDCLMINIGIRSSTFRSAFSGVIPSDSLFGEFFSNILATGRNALAYILFPTGDDFREDFQKLMLTYITDSIYTRSKLNLQMSLMFLQLLDHHSDECMTCSSSGGHIILAQILHYMEGNYSRCNVNSIAKHFGYTPDHLNRIFKENMGRTVKELLMDITMKEAASLLTTTSHTVAEISDYLGYSDTTNLIRNFKKLYGVTPSKYRTEKLKQ